MLGLVGKGLTFDTGGLSLKPARSMTGMKFDMSGAAAVLEATAAIAELELPIQVVTVVGAVENLVSATGMRPDDVVRAANGKTIEITNTDAEGRLVLADCLHHARTLGATHVVDLATLTGAMVVALGDCTPACSAATTSSSSVSAPPASSAASTCGGCRCTTRTSASCAPTWPT